MDTRTYDEYGLEELAAVIDRLRAARADTERAMAELRRNDTEARNKFEAAEKALLAKIGDVVGGKIGHVG